MVEQYRTDIFSDLGQKLSQRLGLTANEKVRIYETVQLAVCDTTISLQQFLMHKPQIGLVKKGSSVIEAMVPMWLQNQTPLQMKSDQQTWLEYIESLSKDTNFVIWASENEITGEVIVPSEEVVEIHKRLADKRIYSIQIQHQSIRLPLQLSKYSIVVKRPDLFSNQVTVVVSGEKVKARSVIGEFQNLKLLQDKVENLKFEVMPLAQQQDLEKKWSDSKIFYFNYFATPCERLTDRVVFWFEDLMASSVKEKLGLSDRQAFAPSELPFWYLQFWSHWWKEAESEKLLRGLLILNAQVVKEDSNFTKKMEQAISEIRQQSQWSV